MLTSLIFIATFLGILVITVAVVVAVVGRKRKLASRFALLLGVWLISYCGILLVVSLTSSQTTLSLNQEHCFDEMCFSVIGFDKAKTINTTSSQATAQNTFYLVQLQLRNAARRIAQKPDSPDFVVVDQQGHSYSYSQVATIALNNLSAPTGATTIFWETKLNPAEKSVRTLAFDLPSTIVNPCLVVSEGGWPTQLIIDDENSFFHQKTQICLNP